jgi:hypothetical protein
MCAVEASPVGADLRVCPSTNATHAGAADGATTGGCPYAIWTIARCTIIRRGRPLCLPIHKYPTQAPADGATTGVVPTRFGPSPVVPSPVGADPRVRPSTNTTHTGAADGATTGGCPYAIWTIARCTIIRRGRPLCLPIHKYHPRRRPPTGQPRGLPLRFAREPSPVTMRRLRCSSLRRRV